MTAIQVQNKKSSCVHLYLYIIHTDENLMPQMKQVTVCIQLQWPHQNNAVACTWETDNSSRLNLSIQWFSKQQS